MTTKTSDRDQATEGCLAFMASLLLRPFAVALNAWMMMTLWGWFVVPTFGARPLTLPQAAGLAVLAGWFFSRYQDTRKDERRPAEIFFYGLLHLAVVTVFTLATAWVIRWFM